MRRSGSLRQQHPLIGRVMRAGSGLAFGSLVLGAALALGCDAGETKLIGVETCRLAPTPPPASLGLDPFYTRYLDAKGIPVLASNQPADAALVQACLTVGHMLKKRDDVRRKMIDQGMRVAVIASNEVTTDIPEYRDLYSVYPQVNWDTLRGVGATLQIPVSSFGEENILCQAGDTYAGEDVFVGTFSSSVLLGVEAIDGGFERRLQAALKSSMNAGLWSGMFTSQDMIAYYGLGALVWFDANALMSPSSGPQNQVNTRDELKAYDPPLAALLAETMPDDAWRPHCP